MDRRTAVDFAKRVLHEGRSVIPLFRYLVLRTETHAFCLALACAALVGFYPFCVMLLSLMRYGLQWEGAHDVLVFALQEYYPTDQEYLIRNLDVSVTTSGRALELGAIVWILVGAAGIFIPLESGFNRLWNVAEDRPYWLNQLVGLALTIVVCMLAVMFLAINAGIQALIDFLTPFPFLETLNYISDIAVLRLTAVCFFSGTILLFYKWLPNRKIRTMEVLPAAIVAGVVAEIVRNVFGLVLPMMNVESSQGPFDVSVTFVILAYFETFVVLGGAFLATRSRTYPWLGLLLFWKKQQPESAEASEQTEASANRSLQLNDDRPR